MVHGVPLVMPSATSMLLQISAGIASPRQRNFVRPLVLEASSGNFDKTFSHIELGKSPDTLSNASTIVLFDSFM